MSAMPRPQQMERVLENVRAGTKVASARSLELSPPWRVVSRDGSTSSLASLSDSVKSDCPDCIAGRCGQNPQACQCSSGGHSPTISLQRVTEIQKPRTVPTLSLEVAPGPIMPQAKPQLFGQGAAPSPVDFLQLPRHERETARTQALASGGAGKGAIARAPCLNDAAKTDRPAAVPSPSKPISDDLQKVIERWPRLSRSTRRAILLLASSVTEADSA